MSHSWHMLRQPLSFLTSLRQHGDIVKVWLGTEWVYFVQHPELLREVLVNSPSIFDKGGQFFDQMSKPLGAGLATCPYSVHRKQRRLVQPSFSRERIAKYATVMKDEAIAMVNSWRPGQVVDVGDAFSALTLSIVVNTLFTFGSGDQTKAEVGRLISSIFKGFYWMIVAPEAVQKLPLPVYRQLDRLRDIIQQLTERYRRTGVDHGDLLSTLLSVRDEDTSEGMTDREISDQVVTFIIGGAETASSVIAWAFYVLSQDPESERRVHEEVDGLLDGRPGGFEDVPKLPYTQRVITEALRLYPPGWILTRRTSAEVDLGGHRIPPGTTILVSPYALHHDPNVYSAPEQFDPDRWLPERSNDLPRGAFIGFGAGQRKCIGEAFAMVEAVIILSTLAGRWRLRPVPGHKVELVPRLTLRPGPMPMRVEPRRPHGVATGPWS